jgi:3-oxoacyl-[acyl-carrier protein] reductase
LPTCHVDQDDLACQVAGDGPASDEEPTVAAEGKGCHDPVLPGGQRGAERLSPLHVPQEHHPVHVGGGQGAPVGAEGQVLDTGASSGIGAATAAAFGAEGARVAITYRSNLTGARATAERVEAAGGKALVVALDLEAPASIAASIGRVLEHWSQLDVLVANAVYWGADRPDPTIRFEDVPLAKWQAMLSANVVGNAAVIGAVLPTMRARRWGRIVLVSSGAARRAFPAPAPTARPSPACTAWPAASRGTLAATACSSTWWPPASP